MSWTRASQLDRTLQCPGHLTLPHNRVVSERVIDAAAYGTMVHRWAETGEIVGSKSHIKTFQKKLSILEANGITRETLWPVSGFHEVTFAYNCVDGRLGVCWLKGDAAIVAKAAYDSDWITGTADYVYYKDGMCGVNDLKTGMMFDAQPDELSQLYFYLMCWQQYNNAHNEDDDQYHNGILDVLHWPKYPIDALPGREERVILGSTITKFEKYIRNLHKKYKAGDAPFVLGAECEYCPAVESCPLLKEGKE